MRERIQRLVVGGCLLLMCGAAFGQTLPPGWSPELGEAFSLYYAGRFEDVANMCRSVAESARSEQVRRDAQALSAMALMRQDSRSDRIDGRTRLGLVAERDPTIMERSDCRFALGAARSALEQTSSALGELLAALEGFARERRPQRALEACVVIADTWSRYGEWNTPIPGLPLAVPESPESAQGERARRVAEMRAKAASLPDSTDAVRKIDFIAARMQLAQAGTRAAAIDALRALASRTPLDEIAADAALRLAEELVADNRGDEAVEVYRRVAAARLGERSQRAETLAGEAARPRVELALEGTPRPGGKLRVRLTANRVRSIELELRRIDLAAHLAEHRGVLLEQNLPDDGAMIGSQAVRPPDGAGTRWTATAEFDAPRGAIVALASAIDEKGAPLRCRQVFAVSAADAAVIAGPRAALIVTTPNLSDGAKARFWMQGSFVPVEIDLAGGCAVMPLPPEARLLRDRRWVCLVTSDAGVALCRGSLPGDAEAALRSVVSIAPEHPHVGEEVLIAGVLVSDNGAVDREVMRQGVQIELCDTMDEVRAKASAAVDAAGVFSVRLRIAPELAGAIFHPVVRGGGRVFAPLYRPVLARVATGDPRAADLELNLGTMGASNEGLVRADVRGMTAWGLPLAGGRTSYRLRAVRLPGCDDDSPRVPSLPYSSQARLDDGGRTSLTHPMATFKLPAGPIAMNAEVSVETLDGRRATVQREAIAGGAAHVWIEWDALGQPDGETSPRPLRIGDMTQLRVGWFDPKNLASGAAPRLAIRAPGGEFVDYPLHPDRGGLLAADWSPWRAGAHELRATLEIDGHDPVTSSRRVLVAELEGDRTPGLTAFDVRSSNEGRGQIEVCVHASETRPLLVIVAAQNPLAAAWLPAQSGERRLTIPLARIPGSGAVATLLDVRDGAVRPLGSRPIAPPSSHLRIAGETPTLAAGSLASLSVELADGGALDEATVIARLTSAEDAGAVDWLLRAPSGDAQETLHALAVAGSGPHESPGLPAGVVFPGAAGHSLLRGGTL